MKTALRLALLLLLPATLLPAQPAAAPLQSALLGVPLPDGATISRNGLYRAAARADLKLDATPAGLTLGEPLELIRLPMNAPPRADLLAMLQGGGWTYTARAAAWGVATRGDVSMLVAFNDTRRERWIYVAQITPGQGGPTVAQGGGSAVSPDAGSPVPQPPVQSPTAPAQTQAAPVAPVAPAPSDPAPVAPPATAGGYRFTSTNFDDGWVAEVVPGFVKVTKGAVTAYLFDRVRMTEEMRPPASRVNDWFWAHDVTPRFDVRSVDRRQQDLMYSPTEYLEGEATERATGHSVYVGMLVSRNSGGAVNIVVVAPDRATFRQLYPKPDDLESLLAYNKFAVAPADLVGEWSDNSSAVAQMYYASTGNYAGMNVSSVSAQFFIAGDGTYRSRHAGASGMVGSQTVFQQEYRGAYSMRGNWEVTFTNRYGGKDETFAAQFEAVAGGRVLHLTNVRATGVQYHLVRVK